MNKNKQNVDGQTDGRTDRQTDIQTDGHANLIVGLVTRNPPKNVLNKYFANVFCSNNFLKTQESKIMMRDNLHYVPSKKVLHIQFGGQYNIFCYMSYIIMDAW